MRMNKTQKMLGWTLDHEYTKKELANEILYIKGKLTLIGIFCLFTFPLIPIWFLFLMYLDMTKEENKDTFFDNLKEDISILMFPPKTFNPGSVLLDSKGNVVRDRARYYSNPNGNYKG